MHKFFLWASANKLSINYNKTFYIIHSFRNFNNEIPTLKINDHLIENSQQGLFLGIIIDQKLSHQDHINYIADKISKSIGILFKLSKHKAPKTLLKLIYYSLIHSYLNYNLIIYGGAYNDHLNRLFLLQKRAVRIISNSSFLAHTDPLFFSNKILKIHDMYKFNVGLYMYDNWDSGNYDRIHSYDTRNRDSLRPNSARLTVTQNSISVIGPNVWNSIPEHIKQSPTKNIFKTSYKNYLLANYVN